MSPPILSVVIPTRDRRDILMATLRALGRQRGLDGRFQVIVVDDGSTDDTENSLRDSFFEAFDQTIVSADGAGPARARNLGTATAEADRVLLLGDDTIPTDRALAGHLEAAADREVAVQGRIDWDPNRPISDVMAFLAPAGPQFWFCGLVDGGPVPWAQVLGSNLSAPTAWFRAEPFDERFTDACMEDTELAWRWRRRGWSVIWSDRALCHHRHHYNDIGSVLDRQRRAGRWARLAIRLHPTMAFKLAGEPLLALPRKAVAAAARRLIGRGRRADAWDLKCRIAFLRGLSDRGSRQFFSRS